MTGEIIMTEEILKNIFLNKEDIDNDLTIREENGVLLSKSKVLYYDEATGMSVKYLYQYKGNVTKWHKHNCSHGMYVLEGTLYTDKGDYGPGSFVWFDEGTVMEHGARDGDVAMLFITNKDFDIVFL